MAGLRAVLVVAGQPATDRWLRQVAARWAATGIGVTWLAGHADGLPSDETVDGVRVLRTRGSVAWRACALVGGHDAVLVRHPGPGSRMLSRVAPVVHLVTESPAGRWRPRGSVVVRSPAERRALRADLGLRQPIFVVPQALSAAPAAQRRSAVPCFAVSGLSGDATVRDSGDAAPLDEAWVLVSTAGPATWDATVVEAARRGLPCIARPGSALADVIVDGVTGWLADDVDARLAPALADLADPVVAAWMAEHCRAMAARLGVERGADLLAGVLQASTTAAGHCRRRARPDLSTVVGCPLPTGGLALRATDEVWTDGDRAVALLHGCDEVDARIALARQGITPTFVRLATATDLLVGPALTTHHIG
ncbi:MAG TPA: hypothetical protein VGD84_12480 [Pseudonocardiaceae bacterium]